MLSLPQVEDQVTSAYNQHHLYQYHPAAFAIIHQTKNGLSHRTFGITNSLSCSFEKNIYANE
eukprot:12761448-Ditylum_brightwellii.AAC.1